MPSTYTPIATVNVTSAAATVTFSSIPSTYTDLILIATIGNSANANRDIEWRINGDSGTNYSSTAIAGDGSTAYSGRDTNRSSTRTNGSTNNTASTSNIIQFMNYSNTTTYKTMLSRSNPTSWVVSANVHLWRNTAAITSIVFNNESSANFVAGSTFTLYGVKSA